MTPTEGLSRCFPDVVMEVNLPSLKKSWNEIKEAKELR